MTVLNILGIKIIYQSICKISSYRMKHFITSFLVHFPAYVSRNESRISYNYNDYLVLVYPRLSSFSTENLTSWETLP